MVNANIYTLSSNAEDGLVTLPWSHCSHLRLNRLSPERREKFEGHSYHLGSCREDCWIGKGFAACGG